MKKLNEKRIITQIDTQILNNYSTHTIEITNKTKMKLKPTRYI